MRIALYTFLALCVYATPASAAACKPLVDIIATTLSDESITYEVIPFALVADLNAIYNALPPKSDDNFDGAVVRVMPDRAVILLTRGADVCGDLPPIPAPAWAVLHRRIFGTMA